MDTEMTLTAARTQFTSLPRRLSGRDTLAVTRRGRPVLAVLPWELYESIVETLEILGDRDLMRALRKGIAEADAGRLVPWKKVKKKLRL